MSEPKKMGMSEYLSDVTLGEEYEDIQTGFRGIATTNTFFQHACERIGLEAYDEDRKKIVTEVFDAPRLRHVESRKLATSDRPGGPQMPASQAGPNGR